MYETAQVRPGRGPGHHVQALDGAGDADQARWQSRTGSRSLSACQQVWQPSVHKVHYIKRYKSSIEGRKKTELFTLQSLNFRWLLISVTNISTGQGFTGSTPICRLGCDWLSLSSRNTISTLVNPAKNSAGIWGEHISYFPATISCILLLIFRNTDIYLCLLF